MKDRKLLAESSASALENTFSGLTAAIIKNNFQNQFRNTKGYWYNDDVKKYALTLHFYSPRAYDYVKTVFALPHPSSLKNWTSSVHCEPGFFKDVFSHLSGLVSKDPLNSDCASVFDAAMTIKSLVYYNKAIDAIEGFVSCKNSSNLLNKCIFTKKSPQMPSLPF